MRRIFELVCMAILGVVHVCSSPWQGHDNHFVDYAGWYIAAPMGYLAIRILNASGGVKNIPPKTQIPGTAIYFYLLAIAYGAVIFVVSLLRADSIAKVIHENGEYFFISVGDGLSVRSAATKLDYADYFCSFLFPASALFFGMFSTFTTMLNVVEDAKDVSQYSNSPGPNFPEGSVGADGARKQN